MQDGKKWWQKQILKTFFLFYIQICPFSTKKDITGDLTNFLYQPIFEINFVYFFKGGATTLSIMTLSKTARSVLAFSNMVFSIK